MMPLAAVSGGPENILDVFGAPWKVGYFLLVDLPVDSSSPFLPWRGFNTTASADLVTRASTR